MAVAEVQLGDASRFTPPPRGTAMYDVAAETAAKGRTRGAEFTFAEVKELVEAASPAFVLELDLRSEVAGGPAAKGRYLVAKRSIKVGEVLLSEWPLFSGSADAVQSRKVYEESFFAQDALEDDVDCAHPCCSLADCVAGVILAKQAASAQSHPAGQTKQGREEREDRRSRADLSLRKLATLCRASGNDPVQEGLASEFFGRLLPEMQALTSIEEIHGIIDSVSSVRFGSEESNLDVMFAGSMFEHSCAPNVFLGQAWRARFVDQAREYRALRDIEVGEALSIDYLQLPDAYLHRVGRAELLAGWGFVCACPRCTVLPEVTRSFICPDCSASELCPRTPGSNANFVCQACGMEPADSYRMRCLGAEAALRSYKEGALVDPESSAAFEGLISDFHHAAFEVAWARWCSGPDIDLDAGINVESMEEYIDATDQLIACISRLYSDSLHPLLLPIYHRRAVLQQGDIDGQSCYLEMERQLLSRFYPEVAAEQDSEIMHMVYRQGPAEGVDGAERAVGMDPNKALGALLDEVSVQTVATEEWSLSGMD